MDRGSVARVGTTTHGLSPQKFCLECDRMRTTFTGISEDGRYVECCFVCEHEIRTIVNNTEASRERRYI